LGAALKEAILFGAQEAVKAGVTVKGFCQWAHLSRGLYYRWRRREANGCLANSRPVAKNIPWKHDETMTKKVLEFKKEHPEIASHYAAGKRCGIAPSTAGKILAEANAKTADSPANVSRFIPGWSEWLKIHACWSTDMMRIHFWGGFLYLHLLLEERSRLILGWKLGLEYSGTNTLELVRSVIECLGQKPLVLKHDRGQDMLGGGLLDYLREQKILFLPSPAYYAPFNGRMERTNPLVRRFTRPLEALVKCPPEKIVAAIQRGSHDINDVLPRRMFGGLTSREVYNQKEVYTESDQEYLIKRILQEQARTDMNYEKMSSLDRERLVVLQALKGTNLCDYSLGEKVKLFPVDRVL
jgi:hypothetical protein